MRFGTNPPCSLALSIDSGGVTAVKRFYEMGIRSLAIYEPEAVGIIETCLARKDSS